MRFEDAADAFLTLLFLHYPNHAWRRRMLGSGDPMTAPNEFEVILEEGGHGVARIVTWVDLDRMPSNKLAFYIGEEMLLRHTRLQEQTKPAHRYARS